jgi:shikimate dehydrogenase
LLRYSRTNTLQPYSVINMSFVKTPDRFLLAGVMGWPIMHTRSPMIYNYWFEKHGIAGRHVPLAIEPQGLAAALRALHPLGFAGCNLTLPHKQTAMALVDEVDAVARAIGAISCVVARGDGSLFGTNNDCIGFINNIKYLNPDWRADAGPITVLGAGGGARAVCYALAQAGAREIRVVNRTFERAQRLADDFGAPHKALQWDHRADALADTVMVINTTSQGMTGQAALDIQLARMPQSALACDLIYIPRETPFLAAARARGNRTVNGLGMLLHQAPPAWHAWFGFTPVVTPELYALLDNSL